jgi:hypothetical protein
VNTTHDPEYKRGLGSLKKVAIRAVLAGGLSLALIGPGVGTANAQAPTLTCPGIAVPGQPAVVSYAGFDVGGVLDQVYVTTGVSGYGDTLGQANGPSGSMMIKWPTTWSPYSSQELLASQTGGATLRTASCFVQVGAPGGPQPAPRGGGLNPPVPCPVRSPTHCHLPLPDQRPH